MQEIINRILDGNFDYENVSLDFSCTKIELTLLKESSYEGSFTIHSAPGVLTSGYIVSTDLRMECLTPTFSGNNAEITYCFHGEQLRAGDVVKGAFHVISNHGEYYLPYEITIESGTLETSVGSVKNLFHFANLAKTNWQEAVNVFYSQEFENILQGSDATYLECYRGLSANVGNEQNVEEFLMCIHKKQRVEYLLQKSELVLSMATADSPDAVTEQEIEITRNGWGYTALNVECEGDFLFTEKEFLGDDDFMGNICRLPVFIDTGRCRRGRNYGYVYLFNSYVSLTIPVEVQIGNTGTLHRVKLSRKKLIVDIMKAYEDFRLKKAGTAAWLKNTGKLVEQLVAMDENDIAARLFQAQVLITEERYNEAGWILDHVADLLEKSKEDITVLDAYHMYLTTLVHTDENYVREMAERVERLYRRNRDDWRLAWLLLYLSEEYNRTATGKWELLSKQLHYGCASPVIYIELLQLINGNPLVLRRLDTPELRVLYYGAKNDMLSEEAVEQIIYLCSRKKEYSPLLLKILQRLYERREDVRILQEICGLLVKGSKVGTRWLDWYQKGVDAQLRITNLYEYYMMSVDLEIMQPIPKIVLMYFSYQNNLDYEHSAYLYHYLMEHKEEYPELYATYRFQIEHFVIDQIQKEHMDKHLAAIYREFFTGAMMSEQNASSLAKLLFANWLTVEDSRLRRVYVYQPGKVSAEEYVLENNGTWLPLYGEENTLVFEDAYGNRFIKNVDYKVEELMQPGRYVYAVANCVWDVPGLNLYLKSKESTLLESDGIERYRHLAASEDIDQRLRREAAMKVLKHYHEADDSRGMDEYLKWLQPQYLSEEERGVVVKYMVARGKYDMAYEWIKQYGPYFVEPKMLLRILDAIISPEALEEDAVLLASAMYVFQRGKYNSHILQYLVNHYNGLTKKMRDIWKMAVSFDINCYELCERMLVQMLYSGAFVGEKMDIFRYYVDKGAHRDLEEAFLSKCAYDYFVREKITEGSVFEGLCKLYRTGTELQKVCKLACLKYYAENPADRNDGTDEICKVFLQDMLAEKIHLNFFREYRGLCEKLSEMEDKTILEYRTQPGTNARIYYITVPENGEAGEYVAESMKEAFAGVYFKEFILFFGENLQYYIMEEINGEEQLTESGSLQKSEAASEVDAGRFTLINDMLISKGLQDYDTLDDLLEEYYRKEYMNGELFRLR